MGISLAEYAALHPVTELPKEPQHDDSCKSWQEQQEEQEEAARLKQLILNQLERGDDPQLILYTALRCIGLYSSDAAFTERASGLMDSVYADLMQQSLLTDNAAIAAERLEQMQTDYNDKLKRSINRQLAGYRRIAAALNEALNTINGMEQPAE